MEDLKEFRFWCQKVLPLVYDDSLSYYEILCKVVDYLNFIIKDSNGVIGNINKLQEEIDKIQQWIDNFDTSYVEEIVREYIATMIFVEIDEAGYIVYYIPKGWNDITFNTTGLDIAIPGVEEYGRLVLSY